MPAVSVAMSVYNGERFLVEAIESVLAQTFTDFEFLILDDGSTDATHEIVESYAAQDPRIGVISRENRGLIASLNELLAAARAPLVARMDSDDICKPERFERQVAFLQANPDHGVVGTWCENIDETGNRISIKYALMGDKEYAEVEHPVTYQDALRCIERGGVPHAHPSVMYRRDVVLAAGGYHAAFRHCEDYDLWLRLASITKLANLPEELLRYRHYEGQVSRKHATEQQTGAAIALQAYLERQAGRPDPTENLATLPAIDELDALFGRTGVTSWVRGRVATGLVYSKVGLGGDGFDVVLQHLKEGGQRDGMWRTVVRLVCFGKPARAARLAAALALS